MGREPGFMEMFQGALNDIWYTPEIKWFSILIFLLFIAVLILGGYVFVTGVFDPKVFSSLLGLSKGWKFSIGW